MDFIGAKTLLVKKVLYAFKSGNPVSGFKYTDFTSSDKLVKTALSTLPHNELLEFFSVSKLTGCIVLTGGSDKQFRNSAKTYLMDLQRDRWQ